MKKIFFTAVLFSTFTFVMAQDTSRTTREYKPVAGENNLELNFNPLGATPIQLSYIRYRRFITATTALRLGVMLNYSSTGIDDSVGTSHIATGVTIYSRAKSTKIGWNIKHGFEKHFAGTKRLSPYVGGELDLAGQTSTDVAPNGFVNSTTDDVAVITTKNKNKGGFFRIGANALAGFDFYITKHLYLGTELGFGLQYKAYSKLKTSYSPAPVAPAKQPVDKDQGSDFNLGPVFNSSIRLGFIF